jgi:P pilus assembly chaperone PapD
MRKLLIALVFSLLSVSAFAADIKITSFNYNGSERRGAEICGVVSNMTETPTYVQVVVDYNSKRPATYNTIVGADGNFCLAVVSYYGTAKASTF